MTNQNNTGQSYSEKYSNQPQENQPQENQSKDPVQKIVFVTGNSGKFHEIRAVLADFGIEVIQNKSDYPEIQADDLEPIAAESARAAANDLKIPVMVDDSGLFIQALNGFPGPYSRFVEDHLGNARVLKLMDGEQNRAAYFKTVIAFCKPGEEPLTFSGTVDGKISYDERGDGGFGFDPIFDYNGKTFGELGTEFKNMISHRRRALDQFLEYLKKSVE
ncbi:XTP/dITP diphosphatase [Methanolapillus ohkumae]|uniref:dITP/XTP pyrophosphatase n=1 Tax=Methanolapillus ohkumae TaxID=3028298 RepID=A0AA96V7D9_9EURY|nr:dITP/XTP pyrophosphatase [Methanosarcinaceae archaeon Am2]